MSDAFGVTNVKVGERCTWCTSLFSGQRPVSYPFSETALTEEKSWGLLPEPIKPVSSGNGNDERVVLIRGGGPRAIETARQFERRCAGPLQDHPVADDGYAGEHELVGCNRAIGDDYAAILSC